MRSSLSSKQERRHAQSERNYETHDGRRIDCVSRGSGVERTTIVEHLAACEECARSWSESKRFSRPWIRFPCPTWAEITGGTCGNRLLHGWQKKPGRWWQVWLEPRRLAAAGAVVALLIAAFVAGRITKRGNPGDDIANKEQVRERVLVVAVGEHLGHSERDAGGAFKRGVPNNPAQKEVNISAEQRRAEDLLQENRLYRQTALQEGDAGLASVLDELERVLLDVAHSPEEVTPAQLEAIQKKIEGRGILFKVRVVNKELQQRQEAKEPAPAQNDSTKRERNKSMTIGNSVGKTGMAWIAIAALLLLPAATRARELRSFPSNLGIHSRTHRRPGTKNKNGANASKKRKKEKTKDANGNRSARAGAGKDRAAARIVRRRREDLDEDRYDHAAAKFRELAEMKRSANGCGALLEGVRGEQIGQEGLGIDDHCGLEAAISAEPLAEGCRCAGNRSEAVYRTSCKASRPKR